MLKIIRPTTAGPGRRAPARPGPVVFLTDVERMRLRTALRNLRALYGTWARLAEVMGVSTARLEYIAGGRTNGSRVIAKRATVAAGLAVERQLRGRAAEERCPTCGKTR